MAYFGCMECACCRAGNLKTLKIPKILLYRTAYSIGNRLLTNADIKAYIAERVRPVVINSISSDGNSINGVINSQSRVVFFETFVLEFTRI